MWGASKYKNSFLKCQNMSLVNYNNGQNSVTILREQWKSSNENFSEHPLSVTVSDNAFVTLVYLTNSRLRPLVISSTESFCFAVVSHSTIHCCTTAPSILPFSLLFFELLIMKNHYSLPRRDKSMKYDYFSIVYAVSLTLFFKYLLLTSLNINKLLVKDMFNVI